MGDFILKKVLFCNLDLLVRRFSGWDPEVSLKNRNEFLDYINTLCEDNDNIVCFISREPSKLKVAKEHFDKKGFDKFIYKLRDDAKRYITQHKDKNNYFVFVSGKEVDFYSAVNTKALFIVPKWMPFEDKAAHYGVCVDTPTQFYKFILTLNNNNNWYSQLRIDDKSTCISLMDARTIAGSPTISERQMLINFQQLLKHGQSRNYYEILMYHFLANMTSTTLFDDVELFGMIPSSNCSVNPYIFKFMEQVRYIKNKKLPPSVYRKTPEEQNLLIRHKPKQQMHGGSQIGRANIGATHEFASLCLNPEFETKVRNLKKIGKLNVVIFDDYMDHGNGFNAVRCLLEAIGANKIIFVSMGSFRKQFQKKDYVISGNVFGPDYTYYIESQQVLTNFKINESAKMEVDHLFDIFNK